MLPVRVEKQVRLASAARTNLQESEAIGLTLMAK